MTSMEHPNTSCGRCMLSSQGYRFIAIVQWLKIYDILTEFNAKQDNHERSPLYRLPVKYPPLQGPEARVQSLYRVVQSLALRIPTIDMTWDQRFVLR